VFVDSPPKPRNIRVVLVDKQLQISWEVPIIEHIPLVFEVTLKTTIEQSVTIQDQQSWKFAITERSCGPYQVEIIVSNEAGRNSTTVTGRVQDCSSLKSSQEGLATLFSLSFFFSIFFLYLICNVRIELF